MDNEARHEQDIVLTDSEQTALAQIRDGQVDAYEIIMRRYNQRLFRAARSILKDEDAALDAVQEAYITAFYKLDSYSATGSLGAWLTRITINEALMMKRKPDNRVADKNDNLESSELDSQRFNPERHHANDELRDLIEGAIDCLPDDFRTVFMLRAVQQLSVRETADCLAIPEATVKTRFHRARNLMQTQLDKVFAEAGMHAFEFAGSRCDRIVLNVLHRLKQARPSIQQQEVHTTVQ